MHKAIRQATMKISSLETGEHQFFSTWEELTTVRHIEQCHSPDGIEIEYNSKYVLNIIEEIVLRASTEIPGEEHRPAIQEGLDKLEKAETLHGGFTDLRDDLAYPINKILSELICKTHASEDERKVTEELFQSLVHYSWEAKVVIAFAALAKNYAQLQLVSQLFRTNTLARSVGILMEVDEITATSVARKPKIRGITDLVNAILEVTKAIFEFIDLLNESYNTSAEETLAANAHIAIATYWTMRGIVACAFTLVDLMAMGRNKHISKTLEAQKRGSLAHKLAQIRDHMQQLKDQYVQTIGGS